MENLSLRYGIIVRRLRQKRRMFRIEDMKHLFDDIISYLDKASSQKKKNDGLSFLTTFCDDLATLKMRKLFDHLILRNHPIFDYISQTLELLLIKSNHSRTVTMTKQEEDCFNSISYLVTQLCLYQNESGGLIYGDVPTEVVPVTEKVNTKVVNLHENNRMIKQLTEKLNVKTARLPPNAPKARPTEQKKMTITELPKSRKFRYQTISTSNDTNVNLSLSENDETRIISVQYHVIFLTDSFLQTLVHALDDLSRNEYPSYHVKYKVINRLVLLCSKLNIVDMLLNSVVKCLSSKYYRQVFETMEPDQIRLTPKQIFFTEICPQYIVRHKFLQDNQVAALLSKSLIAASKSIFDKYTATRGVEPTWDMYDSALLEAYLSSSHCYFLYNLSLTPSFRKLTMQSSIVTQLLIILRQNLTIKTSYTEYLFDPNVRIVGFSMMILMNLAYEQNIFNMLKKDDLADICSQMVSEKDYTIHFASKMLMEILTQEVISKKHEPGKLKKAFKKFINEMIFESKEKTTVGPIKNIEKKRIDVKLSPLTEAYLDKLYKDIVHLSIYQYPSNVSKYKEVSRRLHNCTKYETNVVESLLDPVLLCIISNNYMDAYKNIDLSQARAVSGMVQKNRTLALKQMFFMRECPEFLIQHGYKRQKEFNTLLMNKKIIDKAQIIFTQHLPAVFNNDDENDTEDMKHT
ncbi:hypothetical protein I4U23_015437 [Adineta vaga]|nr:hypothetical protein I4U23_015437 [Adineta vaga]